jgi:hypothetical protein
MTSLLRYVRANAIAFLALFVALGGAGYAAISIPRNSVGAAQLRNHSIDPVKFDSKFIGGSVRAWAYVSATGHVYSSHGVDTHVRTQSAFPGSYGLRLTEQNVRGCAAIAAPVADVSHGTASGPGSAVAAVVSRFTHNVSVSIGTFDPSGQPAPLTFLVQVLC